MNYEEYSIAGRIVKVYVYLICILTIIGVFASSSVSIFEEIFISLFTLFVYRSLYRRYFDEKMMKDLSTYYNNNQGVFPVWFQVCFLFVFLAALNIVIIEKYIPFLRPLQVFCATVNSLVYIVLYALSFPQNMNN